jgi:hypothetical protein
MTLSFSNRRQESCPTPPSQAGDTLGTPRLGGT